MAIPIAGHSDMLPSRSQVFDIRYFSSRFHFGFDHVDPQRLRDGRSGAGVVSGEHRNAQAKSVQLRNRIDGGCFNWVRHREDARWSCVDRDKHGCFAFVLELFGSCFKRLQSGEVRILIFTP
jgi:hypothetical protein